ncbi:MAG: hypothetical protein DMG64_16915 [Acidobacteria bacterium]|nr:MAG: hypothetical protein DMG64_16915 [Acidobacteriota bacterium]
MPNPLLYLGIARCDLTVWLAWLSFAQRSSGQGRNRTGRMAQPFHLVLASDSQAKSAPSARDVREGRDSSMCGTQFVISSQREATQ